MWRSQQILCRAYLQWNHLPIILNFDVAQMLYLQTVSVIASSHNQIYTSQTVCYNFNNYVFTTVRRTTCSGFSPKV